MVHRHMDFWKVSHSQYNQTRAIFPIDPFILPETNKAQAGGIARADRHMQILHSREAPTEVTSGSITVFLQKVPTTPQGLKQKTILLQEVCSSHRHSRKCNPPTPICQVLPAVGPLKYKIGPSPLYQMSFSLVTKVVLTLPTCTLAMQQLCAFGATNILTTIYSRAPLCKHFGLKLQAYLELFRSQSSYSHYLAFLLLQVTEFFQLFSLILSLQSLSVSQLVHIYDMMRLTLRPT